MATGLMSTAVSGIQVAQLGLATSSHNIANASTAGYSRQRIVQSTNIATLTGAGFVGKGANVSTIERMYSGFLNTQVSSAQAKVSELGGYYTQISQIDNMLADPNSGLSPPLQDFFSGVQQVTANPSQLPARQAMISSAQALVARFQGIDDALTQMYDSVNGQISTTVSNINSYAGQIGALNEQIIIAQSSISQPANDLLDQRDQLVSELNKLIKVSTLTNGDGSFNVFVGTGQQLVVGSQVSKMTSLPSIADESRFAVGLQNIAGNQELPESLITGGSLGGLLRFRSESLDRVANDVGRNAASLALTFNAQHELGQDLIGQASVDAVPPSTFQSDFFLVSQPTVIGSTKNSLGAILTSTLSVPTSGANFTNLTNSDYRLTLSGGTYTLTRLTDNTKWTDVSLSNLSTTVSATEGFTFDDAIGPMVAEDSFIIQPARAAARNLTVNPAIAADARLVAAAAPIRTAAGRIDPVTSAVRNTNTGGATITAGSVATGYVAPTGGAPVELVYVSATQSFDWLAAGAVAAGSAPYTSGTTITIPGTAISFQISGIPNNGDTFSVARNSAAVSDGRNALAFGQLQTQKTMSGATVSYQAAYAQLVSDNGNKTRELKVTGAAQQALVDQSSAAREALSGVNLDEEAANLLRYQQAYQASAKILDIGSSLFDTLLAIR